MFDKLHRLGFSLFPLGDRLKHPEKGFSWKRYQDQRATLEQVRAWMREDKRFGIACGPVSNLAVIDTDSEIAEQWAQANLPQTPWIVKTAKGFHRYYRYPGLRPIRNTVKLEIDGEKVGPDVRGYGGLVVAPFVDHYDDNQNKTGIIYEPVNWPWTEADVVPVFPVEFLPPETPIVKPEPRKIERLTDAYESAKKWLDAKPTPVKGSRDNDCYVAACHMYGFGLSNAEVFNLVWNWNCASIEPLPEKDIWRIVNSAERGRQPVALYPKGVLEDKPRSSAKNRTPLDSRSGENDPLDLDPTEPPLYEPTISETLTDRQRIEWEYIVSAWEHDDSLTVLSSFREDRWTDPSARAFAQAVRNVVGEGDFDLVTIAQAMRDIGQIDAFRAIERYADANRHKIKPRSPGAFKAFQQAARWDDLQDIILSSARSIGKGDPNKAAAELAEAVGQLLATETSREIKTVKQICEIYLERAIEGEPSKESFSLPLIYDLTGPLGGGDVVPICGPPKAGKSTLLMELAREAAKAGIKCLVSQLELREEQVCERELTSLSGLKVVNISEHTARRLKDMVDLSALDNLFITTVGNTIDTHKAEVWPILASHPEIQVWFLDYNERLYEYSVDPNTMAAQVAKFVKDTAMMFDVCCVVLLQPNDRYYKDGAKGPHIDHIDYGKKWRKDCQWLGFMHHPHFFDPDNQPQEYVELRTMLSRSTGKKRLALRWEPEKYRFHPWEGEAPQAAHRATGTDPRALAANDDLYETLEDAGFTF